MGGVRMGKCLYYCFMFDACACIFGGSSWFIMFQTNIHRKVLLPKILNILKVKS